MSYKIVRNYKGSYSKRTIARGLTLEEAQAHCKDPETSSSTCTSASALAVTKRNGEWFDGYQEENPKKRSATGIMAALSEVYPDNSNELVS